MLAAHPAALRSAVRLEIFTVAWMLVEAALSLGAGVVAGSILLVAFGLDSVLELVSGGVLLWRLSAEAGGRDVELVESIERTAIRVVAVTLVLLCIYVLASSLYGLAVQSKPESSAVGVGISAAAVIVMPWLALQKRRLAGKLGSDALAGDAAESLTCGYMAGTVLVGVGLNALFGWWWVEDAAALVFLFWLGRETWEAFEEAREQGTGASSVEAR
jgi:divalent metal cation (Fe/Co/Zn/Cd) transporter